ncbi:MAG: LysM peptidoglycan-binding domain-containing protein [Desulfurivibrionaceae bacterium]|nr:LysM peptidoglycan-binding domain-containing protein [Desulfurivibrionaceae bacterium]
MRPFLGFSLLLLVPLAGCLQTTQHQPPPAAEQQLESIAIMAPDDLLEETTASEPEATVAEEIKELEHLGRWEKGSAEAIESQEVSYDFPVTINKQVEFYLDFFQNRQRTTFRIWLERSGRYVPMIQQHLKEAGLPLDLAYLPMIESGYSLTAYSRAKAAGPWQFISSTGTYYGLKVNSHEDERRDPTKATLAALDFLSDLYAQFQDWHLAVAAYNAGGGKIRGGLKKHQVDNFWDLAQHDYLHTETKLYVPKLIAAIIIAKNPEKYGFTDIKYHPPLEYEVVTVPRWTSLRSVAVAADADYEELCELNRQLRKRMSPPHMAAYPLKVPVGKKDLVTKNLKKVYPVVTTRYKTHIVRSAESLSQICRLYNLKKLTLLKSNNLKSAQLQKGQRLRIPYQETDYVLWDKASKPPVAMAQAGLILHKIKGGETVSFIARRYGVTQQMIALWNNLDNPGRIRAGQQLAIYLDDAGFSAKEQQQLASLTQKRAPSSPSPAAAGQITYYQVKKGDTLWTISRQFDLNMDKLRRWNSLTSDLIHPGTKLLIKTASL